ncbi:hypothetical protein BU16DRAFT_34244 [Lophium mytilinum]|uniref:NAD dependent epimerase/dehydratase n=1 Tax=Lophium mytilinum TaxID=390894 RepID=A0A6A6RFY2_9PEZI|nr:hypothetical protein BU16DRAFT_34244 [Lophium mytilinum]
MGQEASQPRPGTSLQVIGAGLSRTGTASLSQALEILLDAPVYHGGTQTCLGPPSHITSWIQILKHTPIRSLSDRAFVLRTLKSTLDGYAATTDTPGAQFVPELLELYPDAKVICTVRDPDEWAKSIGATSQQALQWYLRVVLLPLTTMRHFPAYLDALQAGRYGELYSRPGDANLYRRRVWDRHMEYLKKVVPEEKLVFFDVRDGWGPLCDALGVDVPETEFPNSNDGQAIEEFAKRQVLAGLVAWGWILGGIAAVAGVVSMMKK